MDELKRSIRQNAAQLNQMLLRPSKDKYVQPGLIDAAAQAAIKQKLGDFVVQAKDATVGSYDFDAGDFMFEDAVNGKKLDVYGTLAAVKAQFLKKTSGEVEAALQETAAKVTVDDLRKDFGMISSFETVSTNTENGNHNMGLALSRVNGTVLNPGDTFSYENIVGDSTNAR